VRVLVYVEGPGDRISLEKLFRACIDQGRKEGVGISFIPMKGKSQLLTDVGPKAANHLKDNPSDYVFALPDLYPMSDYDGSELQHRSFEQLKALLLDRFLREAERKKLPDAVRSHYRVHCLKHDLEVLLLGAPEVLRQRLNKTTDRIEKNWRKPVEDQNDRKPPKEVVKELFTRYCKRSYNETTDAPWILERARPQDLCSACSQNFQPLFSELDRLSQGAPLD
jgi:hypothetical protein